MFKVTEKITKHERSNDDFSPMSIGGYILRGISDVIHRDVSSEELKEVDIRKYRGGPISLGEELWGLSVPRDISDSGKHELYTNNELNDKDKVFAYNHEVFHYLVKYFQDLGLLGKIPENKEEKIANVYASGDAEGASKMLQKYGLPKGFDVGRLLKHYLKKYDGLGDN